MSEIIIPVSKEFSPHTQLDTGCDTTSATECEPKNLTAFADPPEGRLGVIVFCTDEFRSKNPADYQIMTYSERNDGEGKLKGLVHRAGTARSWPANTWIASYGTRYWGEQVEAAIFDLIDSVSNIGVTTVDNQLVRGVV